MQDYFAAWPQEGTVDLFEKIAELIIMTASRTLMGMCNKSMTPWIISGNHNDFVDCRSCSCCLPHPHKCQWQQLHCVTASADCVQCLTSRILAVWG